MIYRLWSAVSAVSLLWSQAGAFSADSCTAHGKNVLAPMVAAASTDPKCIRDQATGRVSSCTIPNNPGGIGPILTTCCKANFTIESWTLVETQDGLLGGVLAMCSDSQQLASVTAGFNNRSDANCLSPSDLTQHRIVTTFTAGHFNYSLNNASNSIRSFLAADSNTDFSCPDDMKPIGINAASVCHGLAAFQVICALSRSIAPAQAPSISGAIAQSTGKRLSGGAIGGIVGSIVAVLSVVATLVVVLLFLRQRQSSRLQRASLDLAEDRGLVSKPANSSATSEMTKAFPVTTIVPYGLVAIESSAVSMRDLNLQSSDFSTLDGLPRIWKVPLDDVSLVCENGNPKCLGHGGYGIVYQAVVRRTKAAVKIVHGGRPEQQARLLHEIKILEQCKSPHVVQFLGYSTSPSGLLLHMELMTGGTLYHSLSNSDEFRWSNRGASMIREVAEGLYAIHAHNVAHLDIKSLNILLSEDKRAKIADLGLGKLIHNLENNSGQAGTPVYMAPELRNNKCTRASDIFAFGIILWEVCTGRKPYFGLSVRDIRVPEDAPQDVVDLVEACRSQDPSIRPEINEVVDRLENIYP